MGRLAGCLVKLNTTAVARKACCLVRKCFETVVSLRARVPVGACGSKWSTRPWCCYFRHNPILTQGCNELGYPLSQGARGFAHPEPKGVTPLQFENLMGVTTTLGYSELG